MCVGGGVEDINHKASRLGDVIWCERLGATGVDEFDDTATDCILASWFGEEDL